MKKTVNNHFYRRKTFYINECEHVHDTKYIIKIGKKQWSLTATIIEDNVFFCKNECLYMKKLTYVQQTEVKYTMAIDGHPYEIISF